MENGLGKRNRRPDSRHLRRDLNDQSITDTCPHRIQCGPAALHVEAMFVLTIPHMKVDHPGPREQADRGTVCELHRCDGERSKIYFHVSATVWRHGVRNAARNTAGFSAK